MQYANFLEISRSLYSIDQLLPLALEHIDLQVLVQIVDKETHVLSQLQSQSEHWFLPKMLHTADFLRPDIL